MTGFFRDGFCKAPENDSGNHSVAGVVTDQFLDFTASQGNDLRKAAGLKDGQKWCLCAHRWKEAFMARKSETDPVVPRVRLDATHQRALDEVDFKQLKMFAAEQEAKSGGNAPEPSSHPESLAKPSKEIGGVEADTDKRESGHYSRFR
ncbi:MAG: hypothetical protein M1828_002509 [Chrysothrix sp. TS-e1954]|nr:MAG: hypothetical protein M1828_002509 [Chrysothrix sp. TS-e1954]